MIKVKTNTPIGIFDSGLGGLTVMREIERILPGEDLVYFGDTARVPYGNKSKDSIIRFSTENVLFLMRKKVKLIVVACNTSSSLALEYLRQTFKVPIIGVIHAGVEKALKITSLRRIGVIGTRSTIASGSYAAMIRKKAKQAVKVFSQACPLFVPLVEEGLIHHTITDAAIKLYLEKFQNKIDTLILGCTHYPVLKKRLAQYLPQVQLVDSACEVAFQTKELLAKHQLLSRRTQGNKQFYVTDSPREFMKLARLFLHREILKPKVVSV